MRTLSVNVLAGLLSLIAGIAIAQVGLTPEVQELLEKAKVGDASAQFRVANAFDSGRGAPRDGEKAMHWYKAAAEQGLAEAQNSVGSGLQAERKYTEALIWYQKAAAQNHALATNNLAYLHDLGLGVAQDRQLAFKLYLQAAELGWAEAMWNIANMYGAGQLGQPADLVLACTWTLRARRYATEGDLKLIAHVERVTPALERRLSPEKMSSCRDAAWSWSPSSATVRADRREK
jgi:uncharacterized protein